MTKVSVLSAAVLATGFGLFALNSESKAQEDISKKYVKDNSRGILILRPKGLQGYGQYYRNDTLFLHAGKDLIKECKGNVYLNDHFAGHANIGDTVILNKATFFRKAKLEFRRVEYQEIPGYRGAIFLFPKHLNPTCRPTTCNYPIFSQIRFIRFNYGGLRLFFSFSGLSV